VQEEIDLLRVLFALVFFVFASASDWKTRKVSDIVWIILGSLALLTLWIDLLIAKAPGIAHLILLPIAFVFFDIFWDRDSGISTVKGKIAGLFYFLSFGFIIYVFYSLIRGSIEWSEELGGPLFAFVMIVFFEIFYILDVIKGGADAKAMICLAVLFPWYPEIAGRLPLIASDYEQLSTVFTFSLSVLFMAAMISIVIPIYFLFKNLVSRNEISARSLVGFKMSLDEVERHFVWLLEWVENERPQFSARKPRRSDTVKQDIAALKSLGKDEVWVTYKIPFIIPITISIVIILVLGNPLFLLY